MLSQRQVLQRIVRIKRTSPPSPSAPNHPAEQPATKVVVVGTGMLVTPRHVLTCAHVIADALEPAAMQQVIGQQVCLDFPSSSQSAAQHIITAQYATVVAYHPAHPRRVDGIYDMALLELAEPHALSPFCFAWQEPQEGTPVKLIGFPKGLEDVGRWHSGRLGDPTIRHWIYVHSDDAHHSGYSLKGFSGAPVYHPQQGTVLGMASEQDGNAGGYIMIPADLIMQAFDQYLQSCQQQQQHTLKQQQYQRHRHLRTWLSASSLALLALALLHTPIVQYLTQQGYQAYDAHNYPQALRYFRATQWLHPWSATPHYNLAYTLEDSGYSHATVIEQHYLRAIRRGNDLRAKNNLARLYLQQHDAGARDATSLEDSLQLLNQAEQQSRAQLPSDSTNPHVDLQGQTYLSSILKNRAWAQLQLGYYSLALRDIEQALHYNSTNAEAYCLKGLIYEAMNPSQPAPRTLWWECVHYGTTLVPSAEPSTTPTPSPPAPLYHPRDRNSVHAAWLQYAKLQLSNQTN